VGVGWWGQPQICIQPCSCLCPPCSSTPCVTDGANQRTKTGLVWDEAGTQWLSPAYWCKDPPAANCF